MEFTRYIYVVLFSVLVSCYAKPRLATTQRSDEISGNTFVSEYNKDVKTTDHLFETTTVSDTVSHVYPGRVPCDYEEPTDDPICQEHCAPKGYTYGICVSQTCSCI